MTKHSGEKSVTKKRPTYDSDVRISKYVDEKIYLYVNEPKTMDILVKGMKEFQQKYENCIK